MKDLHVPSMQIKKIKIKVCCYDTFYHRRGSCTVVQPEEMLAMEALDATRHRFGLDHLEKLDRIDDNTDDDDDDVFTAEEETYNLRRFGKGPPEPQPEVTTTDDTVVSARGTGGNHKSSDGSFEERKRKLLFEQTTVETIL